jgi:hypothetical protein
MGGVEEVVRVGVAVQPCVGYGAASGARLQRTTKLSRGLFRRGECPRPLTQTGNFEMSEARLKIITSTFRPFLHP